MSYIVGLFVVLWFLVFGLVVCRLLELDIPVVHDINAMLDVLFGTPGSQP